MGILSHVTGLKGSDDLNNFCEIVATDFLIFCLLFDDLNDGSDDLNNIVCSSDLYHYSMRSVVDFLACGKK